MSHNLNNEPILPANWRDKLRWSKANTDYHGLIAFTPAQLEHFVSMLTDAAPLVPEVAASEQQAILLANEEGIELAIERRADGKWQFCPTTFDGQRPRLNTEATTASASTDEDFYLASDGVEHSHPAYGQGVFFTHDCRRATAPSRNAAPLPKQWHERTNTYADPQACMQAMKAEIADLRTALTQQSAAQAPSQEADVILRELVDLRKLKAGYETVPHMHHVWWMREKLADYEARWPAAWDRATAYASNAAIDAAMSAATEQGEK